MDMHALLVALDKNQISLADAEAIASSWGSARIARELVASGLRGAVLPQDARSLAKIALAVQPQREPAKRSSKARTIEKLVRGELFLDDSPELRRRISVRHKGGVDILAVHAGPEGPRLMKEIEFGDKDLTKPILDLIAKDENDGHQPGDEPLVPVDPEFVEIGNRQYVRADVKLVFWIPYRPNSFPLPTRFEPDHWKSAQMGQEMRLAARAMLATGNPTPPDTFPDYDSWSNFWSSHEYRGVLHMKMFMCCPDKTSKEARDAGHSFGYTPPSSEVDPAPPETFTKRLTDDHKDHQNVGSMVSGLMQGAAGAEATHGLLFPVGDQYEDALDLIKEMCPATNESYSKGEDPGIFEHTRTTECLSGSIKFMVRVGQAHNLLNYFLTGRLIGLQGGILRYKLCCDGKLKLSYSHTAIPSQRIYVNNKVVYDFDMLNANIPWAETEKAYYGVTAGTLEGSRAALKRRLLEKVEAPIYKDEQLETRVKQGDGCPSPVPDDWLFDSV